MIHACDLMTDGIVGNVLKTFLSKYGKHWDGRETQKIVGKTPFEASAAIVEDYGLPCSISEFISEISPMFSDQYVAFTLWFLCISFMEWRHDI